MNVVYTKLESVGFIKNPSKNKVNVAKSIDIPENCGVKSPSLGFNLLYGVTALQEFNDFLVEDSFDAALEKKDESLFLPYRVKIMAHKHKEDQFFSGKNIYESSTLDLRRIDSSLEAEIIDFFKHKAIQKYGVDFLNSIGCFHDDENYKYRVIEFFPEFIDDLVVEKKWMKKISSIIWNARVFSTYDIENKVWIDEGNLKTRLTLTNTDVIMLVISNNNNYKISMPSIQIREDFYYDKEACA